MERQLLTSGGKEIKHTQEILNLLQAVMEPQEIAIIHRLSHQKIGGLIFQGNDKADSASKLVA